MSSQVLPRPFVWRRLHSLFGLWIVIFLIEHLLTNSQAALLLGENAKGFVHAVNSLHNLPYLEAIEILLLGVPIAFHLVWGIKYALEAKCNSSKTDGSKPDLSQYRRNKAFTWQRITSWILLIGLILHVVKFRFIEYPQSSMHENKTYYFVKIGNDRGLYTVASRLGVKLYDKESVEKASILINDNSQKEESYETMREKLQKETYGLYGPKDSPYNSALNQKLQSIQNHQEKGNWLKTLSSFSIKNPSEVIAECPDFGTATLLNVRNAFKNPVYVVLYTIFVLSAVFHGFNGLWTFLITWGVLLNYRSQRKGVTFCYGLMFVIGFLGLASIWGTYMLNLRT